MRHLLSTMFGPAAAHYRFEYSCCIWINSKKNKEIKPLAVGDMKSNRISFWQRWAKRRRGWRSFFVLFLFNSLLPPLPAFILTKFVPRIRSGAGLFQKWIDGVKDHMNPHAQIRFFLNKLMSIGAYFSIVSPEKSTGALVYNNGESSLLSPNWIFVLKH